MSAEAAEQLVTKSEALKMLNEWLEKPGIIDLPDLEELFRWQNKLLLWVLQERRAQELNNSPIKGE